MPDRHSPVASMTIFLPPQSLSRRRSSLLSLATSASSSSPRTPSRSCASPSYSSALFFASSTCNRTSTDSWNSSIQEIQDLEREWTPDQSLFLIRTLDALPAHLITPYNGIPPSNLLDKIARGVAQAKGNDWPHSLRATRVRLLELARNRAHEEKVSAANAAFSAAQAGSGALPVGLASPNASAARKHRRVSGPNASTIVEEPEALASAHEHVSASTKQKRSTPGAGTGTRRPLYRQSSMDFMKVPASELQNSEKLARLSRRLQTTDRIIDSPQHGTPSRRTRMPSPSRLLNPSTASSSTLNSSYSSSMSSGDRSHKHHRRSASTLATSAISSGPPSPCTPPASPTQSEVNTFLQACKQASLAESRQQILQAKHAASSSSSATKNHATLSHIPVPTDAAHRSRTRRADSFSAPKRPYKRAPSFGALAQEARKSGMDVDGQSCASSDEEEKMRDQGVKKARRGARQHECATPASKSKQTGTESSETPTTTTTTNSMTDHPAYAAPRASSRVELLGLGHSKARKAPITFGAKLPGASGRATPPAHGHGRKPLHIAIPSSPLKESVEIPTRPVSPASPTSHRGHHTQHYQQQQMRYRPLQPTSKTKAKARSSWSSSSSTSQSHPTSQSPAPTHASLRSSALSPSLASPPGSPSPNLPAHLKTIRRVKRLDLPSSGRRISFNSLAKCTEDEDAHRSGNVVGAAMRSPGATGTRRRGGVLRAEAGEDENGLGMLGSAIQLG